MNGERIKLARKRAGLSLRDLAHQMGELVSAQAIGKYERGEMSPSSDVLTALGRALNVSVHYLMAPQGVSLGEVEFRTKANTSAKDRARVETEVLEWVERYLQIEEILELDSASWSSPQGMPQRIENDEDAENLADQLRHDWSLGADPIPNMTELLEEKGIKVLMMELPDNVAGLTCLVNRPSSKDSTPVIVVNKRGTLERRRFTLAHELAHRVIAMPDSKDCPVEQWCHRFAGAFLVPREHLMQDIGKTRQALGYRELIDLKHLYKVSAAALLMRLEQIGVIDRATKEYAFRTFARGWRIDEPEDLEKKGSRGSLEPAKRFERLVYRALAEDLISLPKAAELLRQPTAAIEKEMKGPGGGNADRC